MWGDTDGVIGVWAAVYPAVGVASDGNITSGFSVSIKVALADHPGSTLSAIRRLPCHVRWPGMDFYRVWPFGVQSAKGVFLPLL